MGRSRSRRPSGTGRVAKARFAVVAGSLLIAVSGALPLLPVTYVSAADPLEEGEAAPSSSEVSVVEAGPVELGAPDAGPGAGQTPWLDPSVKPKPVRSRYTPPKVATELPGRRTRTTRTTANRDGSFTTEISPGALNFKDASGAWQPIDLTLVADPSGPFSLRATASGVTTRVGQASATAGLASAEVAGHIVSVQALGYGAGIPDVAKNRVKFERGGDGPDVIVRPTDQGFEFGAEFAAPEAETSATFVLNTGDLTAELAEDGQTILLRDSLDVIVGYVSAPQLFDASDIIAPLGSIDVAVVGPGIGLAPFEPADAAAPSPTVAPVAEPSPESTAAPTPSAPIEPIASSEASGAPSPAPSETGSPAPEASPSPVASPSVEPTPVPVATPTPVATPSPSPSPSPSSAPPDDEIPTDPSELAPNQVLVTYTVDPGYLADPERAFPITLDPVVCIGDGAASASGCDFTGGGNNFDDFIHSNPSNSNPTWTIIRAGWDARGDNYQKMRGLVYFDPSYSMPDGALIADADLLLTISSVAGGPGDETVWAYRATEPWSTLETWDSFGSDGDGYDTTDGVSTDVPAAPVAGDVMNWDVDNIVRGWFNKTPSAWKAPYGFAIKFGNESNGVGDVGWKKYNDSLATNRPLLKITYVQPMVDIDFDYATLGQTWVPTTMARSTEAKLPLTITNDLGSGITYDRCTSVSDADCYVAGYRWFDAKGQMHQDDWGWTDLPATTGDLTPGEPSALFGLIVGPPTMAPGQYTLRLDLARRFGGHLGTYVWASDGARPSLYYSRNKKILSSDNTRWTGSSLIERAEFPIGVVTGGGTNFGATQNVTLGDGSRLGINVASENLHFEGSGGVGFSDLIPVGLSYGYDSENRLDCAGILEACGWWTNYDERFTLDPVSSQHSYQDTAGNRYFVDADNAGQQISGAPVRIDRPRVTYIDENGSGDSSDLDTTPDVPAVHESVYGLSAPSGDYLVRVPSQTSTWLPGMPAVHLNRYRTVSFSVRTSGALTTGVDFKIHNKTTDAYFWFVYEVGTGTISTGFDKKHVSGTIANSWLSTTQDLYADVYLLHGGIYDDYEVVAFQTTTNGQTGDTFLDAVRFEGVGDVRVDESAPAWSANSGNASLFALDSASGTKSIRVEPVAWSASPTCDTTSCLTTYNLHSFPFVQWSWKKAGGNTVAVGIEVTDQRTSVKGYVTYYAGAFPPALAPNPVQVSPIVPTNWTTVTRNVADDARQILGFFNDDPADGNQGPTPDEVRWSGYKLSAFDGSYALIDDVRSLTLPDVGDQVGATAGDDFVVTYAGGATHRFNRDGLLTGIVDQDGNETALSYTFDAAKVDQKAHRLQFVTSASDGDALSSGTARRELEFVGTQTSGKRRVSAIERLGSTTSSAARRMDFVIEADSAGNPTGVDDVLAVSPAHKNVDNWCDGTAPTGCIAFDYATYGIGAVYDPRYTAGNDYRWTVGWGSPLGANGNAPYYIQNEEGSGGQRVRVHAFDSGASGLYARALYQDASTRAAATILASDLDFNGSAHTSYVAKACAGSCDTQANWPTFSTPDIAQRSEFDGLARVTKATTYRVTGSSPQLVISRRGSNAAAKVDNYVDALRANEIAWTQSGDQYFASVRDSGGENPDLYRTTYAYNEAHQLMARTDPRFSRVIAYAAPIAQTNTVKSHWRFDETSGNAIDVVGGFTGTRAGALQNQPGAPIVNASSPSTAAGKAYDFDGVNDVVTVASTFGTVSGSFSVEAWLRPDNASQSMAWVGSRGGNDFTFDAKLYTDPVSTKRVIRVDVGDGISTWLVSENVLFDWQVNRYYHVVIAVDGTDDLFTVYVDGSPIGSVRFSGTPKLADATRVLKWGNNGRSTGTVEWFNGRIDEAAVYTSALKPYQVRAHYLAGRGITERTVATTLDGEGHPTNIQDVFARNGSFEAGLDNWHATGASSVHEATSGADPDIRSGLGSLELTGVGDARQDFSMLPGQRFRFQIFSKSGTSSTEATVKLSYWNVIANGWSSLLAEDSATATSWTGRAWDITIPLNGDGRVRALLHIIDGTGTVHFDDATILTAWEGTSYRSNGTPSLKYVLRPGDPVSGGATPDATVITDFEYTASAAHPAIFPTRTIAGFGDGIYVDTIRDRDLITDTTFDKWGRPLTVTDPDGVIATTAYDTTSLTFIDHTIDGEGNQTNYSYDQVGNRVEVEDPLDRITTTTYNLDNQSLVATDPLGVETKQVYDVYGRATTAYANYIDGTPPAGSETTSDEDVKSTLTFDAYGRVTATVADDGAFTGAIKAKSTSAYDQLSNAASSTTYADTAYTQPRTTVSHFETYVYSGATLTREKPSGTQLPIAPTASPAPYCPGSTTTRCNIAPRWDATTTGPITTDLDGSAWSVADAYGVRTVTDIDFAGHPIRTVANYGDGVAGPNVDDDVITSTEYDLLGRVVKTINASGLATISTYDFVGRVVDITDPAAISTKTIYLPSGRVDRVARPASSATPDSNRDWTATLYDTAGRATRTLDRVRIDGRAGVSLETFEDADLAGWSTDGAKPFIEAGGLLVNSGCGTCLMKTGKRSGYITTDGLLDNEGAVWDVDAAQGGYGTTFKAGKTYNVKLWAKSATSGETVHLGVYLGKDGITGNYGGTSVATLGTGWTPVSFSWTNTTGSDQPSVYFAIRNQEPQVRTIRFDDVQIWEADDLASTTDDERFSNIPISETVYDAAGQITTSVAPPHLPGDAPLVTATTYDNRGQITGVVVNAITAGSTTDAITNLTTLTVYDDLGRATTATDPRGKLTTATYDRLGRQTKTVANYVDGTPTDGPTDDNDVESRFAYNAVGELNGFCSAAQVLASGCNATNPSSIYAWHYEYDALGRTTKQVPPDNATLTDLDTNLWSYETGGRLAATCTVAPATTSCTASGSHRRTTFTYDDLGRELTRSVYSGASAGTLRSTWTTTFNTDQLPWTIAFTGTAGYNETAAAALNEGTDTLAYTYDVYDRPDQIKRSTTILTDYGYSTDGLVSSRTDGTTGTMTFAYDWADRPAEVTSALFSNKVTMTYGWDNLLDTRALPGSSGTDTVAYDAAKRATAVNRSNGDSLSRTYDHAGNVASDGRAIAGVTGDLSSGTQAYTYDGLSRLTGASGLAWGSGAYEYDLDGNRTKAIEAGLTTTFAYDRVDQLKTQTIGAGSPVSFAYDTQGNLTTKVEPGGATTAMQYDTANRLAKVIDGSSTATFTFDALGRTRTRVVGAATDTYGYVGEGETVHQVITGATQTDSVIGSDGSRLAIKVAGILNWYLFDLHGDVAGQVLTTGAGAVRAYRYRPFGEALTPQGAGLVSPWGYQGALNISPSTASSHALLDIGARNYATSLGAWTSLDSVLGSAQNPISMNRFLYTEANPTSLIDPTGHRVCTANNYPNGCDKIDPSVWVPPGYYDEATPPASTPADTPGPSTPPSQVGQPWQPPSFMEWVKWTPEFRREFARNNMNEVEEWEGWGDNEESIVAWLMANLVNRDASIQDQELPFAIAPLLTFVSRDRVERYTATPDWETTMALVAAWNGFESPEQMAWFGIASSIGPPAVAAGLRMKQPGTGSGSNLTNVVSTAARGGIGPVLKGQAGVKTVIARVEARGDTVLATEVTILVNGIRIKADILVRTASNELKILEVKNGPFTNLTRNQEAVFPMLRAGATGTFRTPKLTFAGRPIGSDTGKLLVEEFWLP